MKNAIILFAALVGVTEAFCAEPPGRILILDNELMIEGDIRRVGEQYLVRRERGETAIPANRVIELVADRRDAYRVMRDRCNFRDFDDRMHLVRWCMENNLRVEALAEAEALYSFRPNDAVLRNLVEGLKNLKNSAVERPAVAPVPAKLPDSVLDVQPVNLDRETFGLFVSRVQPILMNVCGRCHANGQGGNYTLAVVSGNSDRKASLYNLSSTLKQLKKSDPASSPLLKKALTAHGKATQPTLRDSQSPAFQSLEAWVNLALIPDEEAQAPTAPAISDQPKPSTEAPKSPATKTAFGETSTSQAKPEPQTAAKDPFDPAIFNGTIVPKKD